MTPTLLFDGVFEALASTTVSDEEYAKLLPKLNCYFAKEEMLELDRAARDHFPERFDEAAGSDLENLMEPFRVRAVRQYFCEVATRCRNHRRAVRRKPSRYPAMVMVASLHYLIAMGASFAKIGYGRFQGPLCASKFGDWVDARITASAAYAAWLLTNDQRMTARVRHVTASFGFGPKVTTLDAFLAGEPR